MYDTINWGEQLPTYYKAHHYLEVRTSPSKLPPSQASLEVYHRQENPDSFWALAAAKIASRQSAFLEVVQYGVCLASVEACGSGDPGFWLADDSLETDPSFLKVVENEQLNVGRSLLARRWEEIFQALQPLYKAAPKEQTRFGYGYWVVENREKLKVFLAEYLYPDGRSR